MPVKESTTGRGTAQGVGVQAGSFRREISEGLRKVDTLQGVLDEGLDEVAQRTGRRVVQAEATEGSELGNEFGKFEGLWEDRLGLSESHCAVRFSGALVGNGKASDVCQGRGNPSSLGVSLKHICFTFLPFASRHLHCYPPSRAKLT